MASQTVGQLNENCTTSPADRTPPMTGRTRTRDTSINVNERRYRCEQSAFLPKRFYCFLCAVFGTPLSDADRCILGRSIFAVTLFVAIVYAGLTFNYTFFDVKSAKTKLTVTSGVFEAILTVLWCALGVYANRLARRLLSSASFVDSMRLHSKTLFKVPAVILLALFATAMIVIADYRGHQTTWTDDNSRRLLLNGTVLKITFIFQIIQSVLVLVFNLLIAAAVLSTCRTHAVGVRRFIRDLENDGKACEIKHRKRFMHLQFSASLNLDELYMLEHCYDDDLLDDDLLMENNSDVRPLIAYQQQSEPITSQSGAPNSSSSQLQVNQKLHILSKDDILFTFWKLASRMRMSSRLLQRWISSWIAFVLLWLLRFVISWLSKQPDYMEIAEFVLPLVLLLIISSAYAEANGETARVIASITPLQDRLDMIRALPAVDMGMTLYNYQLSYSSIATVVAALGLALSSRVILDEFMLPSPH